MTKEIELAKQHGIQYRLTPEGTTEMWCYDRDVQAFAEAVRAAERERCDVLTDDMLRYAMSAAGTGSPADADRFRRFWRFAIEARDTRA